MKSINGSHVCVGVPSITNDKLRLGQMFCQTLSALGFSPVYMEENNPAALKTDVLLLAGLRSSFDSYAKLLSQYNQARPVTVLWLIDPLPPPQLSERGRRLGFKLAKCNWKKLPPWTRKLKSAVPLGNDILKAVRLMLTRQIKKDVFATNDCPGFSQTTCEQLYDTMAILEWIQNNYERGRIDYVFTSTVLRKQTLKTIGIDAGFVPVGYNSSFGEKLPLERDIDVLFIGKLRKDRRIDILNDVEKILSSRNIKLLKITSDCYGQQRTILLNRAKIMLDIPRFPWESAGMRFLMSMSCGALVVSEYIEDTTPYKPGNHFVQAKASELADSICYYLKHEDQRQKIADSAYAFVTNELTLKNSLLQIMETCCANTAVQTCSK
jgi:hypothetical protein